MIVDYSTARPTLAQLRAAGVTAVGRYIGWDGEPGYQNTNKNLTPAEARALTAAGIAVFVAFEYAANAAAKGAAQGRADGQLAARQLAALGAPPGVVVYFTVDYDILDCALSLPDTPANAVAKLGPVAAYFAAIGDVAGRYRVGGYGGYYAVKRLLDAGLIDAGWQTVAWSGGQRDPRAILYQTTATPPFADADVNVHETTDADFGQWPRPAQPQQPDPAPATTEAAVSDGLIVSAPGVRESRTWPAGAAKQIVMYSDWKGLQDTAPVVDLRIGHLNSQVFDAGHRTVDGSDTYTIGTPDDCNGAAFTRIDDGPATVAWHTNP